MIKSPIHSFKNMPIIRASTVFQKKEGLLSFDSSKATVFWSTKTTETSPPTVAIAVSDIVNLQQTPASNPKVALRLVVQSSSERSPENFTFNFQAPSNARAEQEAITDALRDAITKAKQATAVAKTLDTNGKDTQPGSSGQSAAMAIAAAVTSASVSSAESWYDDQKLVSNHELQRSLLLKDQNLAQRFEESLREKPESIGRVQFAHQFWSSRLHLLRAHAIERNQSHGTYNVLAEAKPKVVDGSIKLNLSKEQVKLIFSQHPIVKHVYNDVVPKISENEFWTKFFVSRLLKQLKGERITDADPTDPLLDKYLNTSEETLRNKQIAESRIPHFMDLEGNEQNHSRQQGNRPDFTMRPNTTDKVPILRVLNNMSEKMLSSVAQPEGDIRNDLNDDTFNELRLRDLQAESEEERIILKIRNQARLFGGAAHTPGQGIVTSSDEQRSADPQHHTYQNSVADIRSIRANLRQNFDLESTIAESCSLGAVDDDSKPASPASSTNTSVSYILSIIEQQRTMLHSSTKASTLSPGSLQSLQLTHNTTTEFLHYFWSLLLASSPLHPHRELTALLATLNNSLSRISAVADDAEKERQNHINDLKRQAAEYMKRTGKRKRIDEGSDVGGKREVEALMAPTIRAIAVAKEKYQTLASSAMAHQVN